MDFDITQLNLTAQEIELGINIGMILFGILLSKIPSKYVPFVELIKDAVVAVAKAHHNRKKKVTKK